MRTGTVLWSYTVRRMTVRKQHAKEFAGNQKAPSNGMHGPLPQTGAWLRSVVRGYFNYYAVSGSPDSLEVCSGSGCFATGGHTRKRRSQMRRYVWVRRLTLAAQWLPTPRVLHP